MTNHNAKIKKLRVIYKSVIQQCAISMRSSLYFLRKTNNVVPLQGRVEQFKKDNIIIYYILVLNLICNERSI